MATRVSQRLQLHPRAALRLGGTESRSMSRNPRYNDDPSNLHDEIHSLAMLDERDSHPNVIARDPCGPRCSP